jgi:hypothetical protein
MQTIWRAGTLAVLSLAAAAAAVAADVKLPLAEQVRLANRRFEDSAAAVAEGYTAIACRDGGDGVVAAMRYVNATYLEDEVPSLGRPQALMYEPGDDGHLGLVAVEYVTFKGPAWMEGQPYRLVAAPNRYGRAPFYDLVVWVGEREPTSDALICRARYFE